MKYFFSVSFRGCWLLGLVFGAAVCSQALPTEPLFRLDLRWSGSWERDKSLINRGDLRLHALGLTARGQVTDKRPVPPWENTQEGITALGAGLYHNGTGSRFLYGLIDESGLAPRLRNPGIRSVPFLEYHQPSTADLKTAPSSTGEPAFYLNLASPSLGPARGFASVHLDEEYAPAFGGGFTLQFAKKINLGMEGLFKQAVLPPRYASSWFSETPPLPERDFRIYGLNLTFTVPFFGISADMAYSETFAFGRDPYGNIGITLGDRPWRLSLAVDAAGDRYVGSDGSAHGSLFRAAGRFEWRGKRSSLFRISTSLRGPGLGEPFARSSSLLYYRFPAPSRKFPFGFSRVSLELNRNALDPEDITDSLEGSLGLILGPVRTVFQGTLSGTTRAAGTPVPYPGAEGDYQFASAKVSGELSYSFSLFQLKTKLGYSHVHQKEPLWDLSLYGSVWGKFGRFSAKFAWTDFPGVWTYTFSWNLKYGLSVKSRK
ncbi:MAG: hypothetical protein LBP71_03730 [Spirochaetaceae bacterium]|jgi:hypothetical protein|nr:hypothetical protein [Spirochaetaceae bacterium]